MSRLKGWKISVVLLMETSCLPSYWFGVRHENISLVGFSTKSIGKWSGQTNPARKLEKLEWMLKILQMVELSEQVETNAS